MAIFKFKSKYGAKEEKKGLEEKVMTKYYKTGKKLSSLFVSFPITFKPASY